MIEKFLAQYKSLQTVKSYRSKINLFLKFLEEKEKKLDEILQADIYEFLKGKKESTANSYLNTIRSYYKYVTKLDLTINSFKTSTYRPDRNLSLNDAQKLVFYSSNHRDKLILKLALETGIRVNEIANLTKKNIKYLGKHHYLEFIAKGNKQRIINISKDLANLLKNFCSKKETIFGISARQIQRIIKKLGQETLEKEVTPHCLRHCFATELFKQGVSFDRIRQALGHENIMTTLRYIHNNQDKESWNINIKLL